MAAGYYVVGSGGGGADPALEARVDVVEDRVTVVEGATSIAGVEVANAQGTVNYDIRAQASNTTFTDVTGMVISVPAQTRAYNVTFSANLVAQTNSSFVGPKYIQVMLRIVNSGVTENLEAAAFPFALPISGSTNYLVKANLLGRVPAGRGATTWKVQARIAPSAPETNITAVAIQAGPAMATPVSGLGTPPMQLQAITV